MRYSFFLTLIAESISTAFNAIRINKLRSSLSIMGITIGIYCIVLVFTITDSMENNIRKSIESLGSDVLFIQKWPWEFGENYPWWKYMNRPNAALKELHYIKRKTGSFTSSCYIINLLGSNLKYGNNSVSDVGPLAVSHDWNKIRSFNITDGRYFTEDESTTGHAVVLLGRKIADGLFGVNASGSGKIIRIKSTRVKVIGVFDREGESIIASTSLDNQIIMPLNYARNFVDIDDGRLNPTIYVKPKNISLAQLEPEIRGVMRNVRKLNPGDDDNFALNKITLISNGLQGFFTGLTLAGWIIGGLSILVGGFGIANIMFVSVKERTHLIGIQKSLGARNSFILIQFLAESVILTLIGGVIGILLVYFSSFAASSAFSFNISLGYSNFILGSSISIGLGIVFGIVPAYSASKLNPIEAIRSGF